MKESLRVYNVSTILSRELEFLVTFVWTEPRILRTLERLAPFFVNVTRLYAIDDTMEFKMTTA